MTSPAVEPPGPPSRPATPAPGRPRRRLFLEVAVATVAVVFLASVFWFGGRWLAGTMASKLPYSVDQQIGRLVSTQVMSMFEECTNPNLTGPVNAIVEHLAGGVDPAFGPFEVHVLEDQAVNAFALPGGYLFVFTGLIADLESTEELVGVLGHEMGHVVERHHIARLARSVWFRFLLAMLLGGAPGFGDLLTDNAANLVEMSFSRDEERESDNYGLDLMVEVGIDPGDYPDFFERLPEDQLPQWALTHPHPRERARELRQRIAEREPVAHPWPLPALADLQSPCR